MTHSDSSQKQLTVAHFMPWSGIGGVEIATLRLVDATRDRFRHIAFCLEDATSLRETFEKLGVETIIFTPPIPSIRHVAPYFKQSRTIARRLQTAGVDIVHFSDEKAAHHNSLAARLARVHTICHLRVSYPQLSWRQRLCLRPVDSFVFVSQEALQTFCMPLPQSKKRVIYDAVEIPDRDTVADNQSIRQEFAIPADSTVVGTVARVSAQKDYKTLGFAAAEILRKHPNTIFFIVGDNSLVDLNRQHFAEVCEHLKQLKIMDRFIFTGHRTDVTRLIAAMDIAVLCTHREGFPLSILELMAMRKPVIATAVGGIPEIVIPGVTGYLHAHENSAELASAISSLIEDPAAAHRIAMAGYELVKQSYSREHFVAHISRAYSDVMSR